jgi:uncharacterized protein
MRRSYVLVLLLILLTTPLTVAEPSRAYETRELTIVAVSSLPNGSYIGVTAKLSAGVSCPGSGRVYVETLPLSQIDLQASTRVAAIVASRIAGIRFTSCDFFASIRADTPIVGGPSASAATAVAFAAALLHLPLRGDVVMTGMILPDGSVGPVGGLRAKLEAAAGVGAKVFIVPYGQTRYAERVVVPQTAGPITIYTTKTVIIDLADYGRRLGVEVLPVATIHEALNVFTGGLYKVPNISLVGSPEYYLGSQLEKQVASWVETLRDYVGSVVSQGDSIKASALSSLTRATRLYVESLLGDIESSIKNLTSLAEAQASKGLMYSASSSYFQALIYALWRLYLLKGISDSQALNSVRTDVEGRAIRILDSIRSRYSELAAVCLQDLDVAIAVASRAYESLIYLNTSKTETYIDRSSYYLALASSRAITAELWRSLLNMSQGYGYTCCYLDREQVEDSALALEDLIYNIYTYIISFEGQVDIPTDTFNAMVTRMNAMKNSQSFIDRLALGVDALAYGYATLVVMFSQDAASSVVGLNRSVSIELTSLRECVPTSLLLYMELTTSQENLSKIHTLARVAALLSLYTSPAQGSAAITGPTTVPSGLSTSQAPGTTTVTLTTTVTIEKEPETAGQSPPTYFAVGLALGAALALIAITTLRKPKLK